MVTIQNMTKIHSHPYQRLWHNNALLLIPPAKSLHASIPLKRPPPITTLKPHNHNNIHSQRNSGSAVSASNISQEDRVWLPREGFPEPWKSLVFNSLNRETPAPLPLCDHPHNKKRLVCSAHGISSVFTCAIADLQQSPIQPCLLEVPAFSVLSEKSFQLFKYLGGSKLNNGLDSLSLWAPSPGEPRTVHTYLCNF